LLSLLLSISSSLSASELSNMKFLCQDKIKKRKLESVQSGMDLFTILMEQQEITNDNLSFLRKMLERIERGDLVLRVKQFEEEGELSACDDQPDPHQKPTDVICDNVGREWKRLMRELGLSDVQLDRIEAAHRFSLYEQLLQGLRHWQKVKGKDAKVTDLIAALRGCNLNLVADIVEE
ncbi:Protein FADD, partial [Acanthisitta chloris]